MDALLQHTTVPDAAEFLLSGGLNENIQTTTRTNSESQTIANPSASTQTAAETTEEGVVEPMGTNQPEVQEVQVTFYNS